MPEKLILYTNPMSRGRIVRWMLEETGVAYETEYLEFGTTMKEPEYLAVNPMGKVPAIRHGDLVVTETAAICAYLADTFPDADLSPPPGKRGEYYRWLFFAAGPLEYAVTNKAIGFEPPEDRQGMVGYGNYDLVINTLEKELTGKKFIAGDKFSAADVYLGSHVGWGMEFGSIDKRPAFEEYWSVVGSRDACRRAKEIDDAAMGKNGAEP